MITGAAGRIGSAVRKGLRGEFGSLLLVDREGIEVQEGEEALQLDLRDLAATVGAMDGVEAVVHLAALPDEASFDDLVQHNIVTTYNVLEAARRQSVRRVVLASSNHATGFYPREVRIGPHDPPRPDTLYGVTKVFAETLGRLYSDKHGLEVVCLRIGSFAERPTQPLALAMWISPRDMVELVRRSLMAPVDYAIVYGVSANERSFYENPDAERIGYRPHDNAERWAARLEQPDDEGEAGRLQGGPYTRRDYGKPD